MTILLDDHLLRDWLARPDHALVTAIDGDEVATTNLWYARLCKSAARSGVSSIPTTQLAGWDDEERRALVAGLVALPDDVRVLPLRLLAWPMGELIADHHGLSTLGGEAVAAAVALPARVLVSARDDGPGIRRACAAVGVGYATLER